MAHKVFIAFLGFAIVTALAAMSIRGCGYYLTPGTKRAFHPKYAELKPTGTYSHGLGIIGAGLITIGVVTYSSRKRLRMLWSLGKLSIWLEFHIFVCLLGPILVVYHTTFKAGGVAAISLWTMLSVAGSGVIGRFLYAQIPRNLAGAELSETQIRAEIDRLGKSLSTNPLGAQIAKIVDESFAALKRPDSLWDAVKSFVRLRIVRRHVSGTIRMLISTSRLSRSHAAALTHAADARAILLQRALVVSQVGKLFHLWHVIHLPFSAIMFITLAAHVAVTVALGYHWIF